MLTKPCRPGNCIAVPPWIAIVRSGPDWSGDLRDATSEAVVDIAIEHKITIISRGTVRPAPVRLASVNGSRYADRTPDDTSIQRQLIEDSVFGHPPDTPAMVYSRHDRAPHQRRIWALIQESTSSRFA
ncbi:MAG: hypothetical protein AAGI88_26405 [Pseudomonadota bacterium]